MKYRFIIIEKSTGKWTGSVFAERFEPYGANGGHFYVGQESIASADLVDHQVSISGELAQC